MARGDIVYGRGRNRIPSTVQSVQPTQQKTAKFNSNTMTTKGSTSPTLRARFNYSVTTKNDSEFGCGSCDL